MIKNSILRSLFILILLLPIVFLGCSSSGGDAPAPVPSPSIRVLPSSYDFGAVTPGNSPATLEVEIQNNGSLSLTVNDITLSDPNNFNLNLNGGSNPCNKTSPKITAGGNCTAEVDFLPQATASFNANLTIRSNASNTPTLKVPLSGSQEEISALNVRINQVESDEASCPGPGSEITAYVSVTDQGGYPITGLTAADFTITETDGYAGPPNNPITYVGDTATISVALVMDYSGSVTDVQDAVDDMEESAAYFVDQLRDLPGVLDEAEIIKFDTIFEVVQGFTSDKDLLKAAIDEFWDNGRETTLFDAVVKAVDDTALQSTDRRAVIVISDGKDTQSLQILDDVINDANNKGVPIFTIGLGILDSAILQQIADDTGGTFFEATTSDNLRTIYEQLANVLFHDSYILTYDSNLGAGVTANLTIEGTYSPTIKGNDTKEITACP